MFCKNKNCDKPAVFKRDFCAAHVRDRDQYTEEIKAYLAAHETFEQVNFSSLSLCALDLSNKEFVNCDFSFTSVEGCSFQKTKFHLMLWDRARIVKCDFSGANIRWSLLAGALLEDCSFVDTDIFRSSLNACEIKNACFHNSNLYSSRFISAVMHDVEFTNCNLLRVHFEYAELVNVNFKNSNTQEAFFEKERIEQ
jgi:uncharacterized protein YjbI with pentapeptide repeats